MLHLRMFSMSVCSHTYANMHKPYQAIRHMGIQAIKALFTTSIRRQYVGIHRHDPFAERASLYCRRDNTAATAATTTTTKLDFQHVWRQRQKVLKCVPGSVLPGQPLRVTAQASFDTVDWKTPAGTEYYCVQSEELQLQLSTSLAALNSRNRSLGDRYK